VNTSASVDNLFLKYGVIMTPHVMKRDGCKVPFKSERIKEAILRAAKAAGVDDADYCATVAEVVSQQMQGRARSISTRSRPPLRTS
jgi:anaerobic ribonucleoside-triphosphate reductase